MKNIILLFFIAILTAYIGAGLREKPKQKPLPYKATQNYDTKVITRITGNEEMPAFNVYRIEFSSLPYQPEYTYIEVLDEHYRINWKTGFVEKITFKEGKR